MFRWKQKRSSNRPGRSLPLLHHLGFIVLLRWCQTVQTDRRTLNLPLPGKSRSPLPIPRQPHPLQPSRQHFAHRLPRTRILPMSPPRPRRQTNIMQKRARVGRKLTHTFLLLPEIRIRHGEKLNSPSSDLFPKSPQQELSPSNPRYRQNQSQTKYQLPLQARRITLKPTRRHFIQTQPRWSALTLHRSTPIPRQPRQEQIPSPQ